jgi:hypothetical protein
MKEFVSFLPVFFKRGSSSILAWPAWLRVLVVLPVLLILWCAVLWAHVDAAAW